MDSALYLAELQVLSANLTSGVCKNLTDNEYKVMVFLKIYGVCSPKILINKIGILKTNLALTLKKLIVKNFVSVNINSNDARSKQYSLTNNGVDMIDSILNQISKLITRQSCQVCHSSLKNVVADLNKVL